MTLAHSKVADSIVDAQVERLLDVVQSYHKEYCEAEKAKARQQAGGLIQQAHHDARKRMHQVVLDNRERIQQEIDVAKAKQQTEKKQRQYRCDQRLLKFALDKLQQMLVSRWQLPEQRRVWIEHILGIASTMLLTDDWRIEYPADCSVAEKQQLRECITKQTAKQTVKQTGQSSTLVVNRDISAGIRISSNGLVVDGTLSGLLVNRSRIEAEFLAQYRIRCGDLQQADKEKDKPSE